MTIAFFSNILNIHQIAVADELYKLCDHQYWFVSFGEANEETLKGGKENVANRPYHIRANENEESLLKAREIALTADIVIYGLVPDDIINQRIKLNKITILYTERWLKRGIINILSPILLKRFISYQLTKDKRNLYCLCASAYAKGDFDRLGMYKDKCFKWGYFIEKQSLNQLNVRNYSASTVKILWVARFLQWKHPERMLQLCKYLIANNCNNFKITMIGNGPEFEKISKEISNSNFTHKIKLLGSIPNNEVKSHMQNHDIFCFTSDKNEGWGVVLNEAMSNGCCVVANDEIGSVPYLIEDGKNGLIYHDGNVNQFCEKIKSLIDNPDKIKKYGKAAMKTINTLWSPENAAEQLYKLCSGLMIREIPEIAEGPCSKA